MRLCAIRLGLCLGLLAAPAAFGFWADEIYQPGPGVSAPRVIHKVYPRYTPEARRALVQGTAVLEVVVDEQGLAARITTVSPIGFGLDDRAKEAVGQWLFKPGRKNGRPVKTVTMVAVDFRLFHRMFDPRPEERRTSFNLAVEQIHEHRRTGATLETIKTLAQQKYPPAMYLYAKLLESGDGFPRDPDLALQLIMDAAAKHFPAAMFDEGRMLLEGRRLEKDPDRGLELVRDAAILHSRAAQFFLASGYERGGLLPQDAGEARRYYRLCALQGEPVCQVRLAQLLIEKPGREERDYLQAIAWLEMASDMGDPQARQMLEPQRGGLSESQAEWVDRLKAQLSGN